MSVQNKDDAMHDNGEAAMEKSEAACGAAAPLTDEWEAALPRRERCVSFTFFRPDVPGLTHLHRIGPAMRVQSEQLVPASWIRGNPVWKALLHMAMSKCVRLMDAQHIRPSQHLEVELRMGCYDAQTQRGVYVADDAEAKTNQMHDMREHDRYAIQCGERPAGPSHSTKGGAGSTIESTLNDTPMIEIQPKLAIPVMKARGSGGAPSAASYTHLTDARFEQLLKRMEALDAVGFEFLNVTTGTYKRMDAWTASWTELIYDSLPNVETPHTRVRKVMYGTKPGPMNSKQPLWTCSVAGPRLAYDLPYEASDDERAVHSQTLPASEKVSGTQSSHSPVQWPLLDVKLCVSLEEIYANESSTLPSNYIIPYCKRVLEKHRRTFTVGCVEISFTTFHAGPPPSPASSAASSSSSTSASGGASMHVDYQIEFELKLPRDWKGRASHLDWAVAIQDLFFWFHFLNCTEL